METIYLNVNGHNAWLWRELERIQLITIDSEGGLHGKRGLSSKPRWCGGWDGIAWRNSCINLSDRGKAVLRRAVLPNGNLLVEEARVTG